jgi:hypothetical protein
MFPLVNPWTPNFARVTGLGQLTPLVPPSAPAPAATGPGQVAAAVGASLLTLGVVGISVAFTYGIARESKSSLVKVPGYILAGVGSLVALVEAGAVGYAVMKA